MYDLTACLDTLAAHAQPEGGWGYAAGQRAHLEPTALGILALSLQRERFTETLDLASKFLNESARGDGTYRLARGRDEAVWPTALVLFVQAARAAPRGNRPYRRRPAGHPGTRRQRRQGPGSSRH